MGKVVTKKSSKPKRARELASWDMPTSPELIDLARRHDRGALTPLDEFRPFHFREAFFTPAAQGFDAYLFQAQKFGWPVYWLAHFAGLHPIGASGGGDYWLARVAPERDGTSRVYRYDHETGVLRLDFPSIGALVEAAKKKDGFEERLAFRAAKLAPSDDPIALWARASWAADFIGAGALNEWTQTLAEAAPLTTFTKETKALAARPDLAAYWLLAHALLGNANAFARAHAITKGSKNPFVAAMRPRLARFVAADAKPNDFMLLERSSADVVNALAKLRKVSNRKLREGEPRALPNVEAPITVESLKKLCKEGALLAFVAARPDHEKLHVWAMQNIDAWSKRDAGPVEAVERIADVTLTKARLRELGTWISFEPLVSDAGQREAKLLALLVKRKSKRAPEIVLRTLSFVEKIWTRPDLARAAAPLAAKLDRAAATPILKRMANDATWKRYTPVMTAIRNALA